MENLKKTRRDRWAAEAKILAGILPVVSQRNAIFMENEVNGIHVDAAIIDRFAGLDRAAGRRTGHRDLGAGGKSGCCPMRMDFT